MNKIQIIELSKTHNSLEISRILNLSLEEVEKILIDYYYVNTWKISKEQLTEAASRIYFDSPDVISGELNISDITLRKYLGECKLYNSKRAKISLNENIEEYIDSVILDYNNNLSIDKLMIKYRLSKNQILKILHSNNISTSKISCNEHIFDVIDTEEKAYWLGFLYADGNVSSNTNHIEISLKLLDAEHLYKFKKFINSKRDVKLDFKIKRCRFTVCSTNLKQSLINLGCIPNKSLKLTFPTKEQVPEHLLIPFIRGYYDGDGVLSYRKSNDKSKCIINTGMLGTENFLKGVINFFDNQINGILHKANKEGTDKCKIIQWYKNDSKLILNTLYENANIYLTRKYKRYEIFKQNEFAVLESDFKNNDETISVKAKEFIINNFELNEEEYNKLYVNTEITEETKESSAS